MQGPGNKGSVSKSKLPEEAPSTPRPAEQPDALPWERIGPQGTASVNTTPQMTCFRGAKRVHIMATRKSDDELLQHDNKLRIWTRSGKFRKVENPELSMAWCQSTTRMPMTSEFQDFHIPL